MSTSHPYHHGNVREAVLDAAVLMLDDRSASELSLREIASEIGVTHAAPRRYFADRQALLDALAVEGFVRLGGRLREAAAAASAFPAQVRALAATYLDFTVSEANLVEVMYAHKRGSGVGAVARSADAAFAPMLDVFRQGRADGMLEGREPEHVAMLFLATLQGIGGLANCGVIPAEQVPALVDDVAARYGRNS